VDQVAGRDGFDAGVRNPPGELGNSLLGDLARGAAAEHQSLRGDLAEPPEPCRVGIVDLAAELSSASGRARADGEMAGYRACAAACRSR
jgi:hypothetical protein